MNTLSPTLFLIHISDLPDIIFNTAIYPDDTTLYSKCDQAQDLWQKPELASGLESDLRDTVAWDIGLLISMLERFSFHVTGLITLVLLMCNGWLSTRKNIFELI